MDDVSRQRGNGEGTVWQCKGKRLPWRAVITVGWTPEGRPIRRSRSASSEREARAMLADMLRARSAARPLPDNRLTVSRHLNAWLPAQTHLRAGTMRAYDRAVRLLDAELGQVPLRRLRASEVQAMLNGLAARGVAVNTVLNARSVLARALSDAQRDGIIPDNAARLARGPRGATRGLPAPATEDVRAVLAWLEGDRDGRGHEGNREVHQGLRGGEADEVSRMREGGADSRGSGSARRDAASGMGPVSATGREAVTRGHRLHALYVLLAATGLRLGEALGLTWDDVGEAEVRVRYQLATIAGERVHAPTKSAGSAGVYALAPLVVRALERHRARQAGERLAAGRKWIDRGLVFTAVRPPGEGIAESTAEYILDRACRDAGVRHMSPHDLRRWAATAIADRIGRDVAQRLLGHTSGTTTDIYISATDDARRRVAAAMEEALGGVE
jgi:integrase